jgi:hypothetical protein
MGFSGALKERKEKEREKVKFPCYGHRPFYNSSRPSATASTFQMPSFAIFEKWLCEKKSNNGEDIENPSSMF